ncbi:MAG: hypothetical protein Roseis2KO_52560 [Roseivirga sp.]
MLPAISIRRKIIISGLSRAFKTCVNYNPAQWSPAWDPEQSNPSYGSLQSHRRRNNGKFH